MRVTIRWTDNDNEEGFLDEHDDILGADTTIKDLKGLIKLWTNESVHNQVLVCRGKVCENAATLAELGIRTQADADATHFALMLEEDAELDVGEGEFTHEAYVRALRAAGRSVLVDATTQHSEQLRREEAAARHYGRARPRKLQEPQAEEEVQEDRSDVYRIFQGCLYGMRAEGVDEALQIRMGSGKDDLFEYWDLRLPEDTSVRANCNRATEIVLEVFYFGELGNIRNHEVFKDAVCKVLREQMGVTADALPVQLRDAGCMYPLTACTVVMSHEHATKLGRTVFEHFGIAMKNSANSAKNNSGKSGNNACGTQ